MEVGESNKRGHADSPELTAKLQRVQHLLSPAAQPLPGTLPQAPTLPDLAGASSAVHKPGTTDFENADLAAN